MSICAENITWKAGKKVIVNNVSLRVSRGETVGLLGPNGCGKSSLLRVLAGLRRPDAGRVTLDGQDITRMAKKQLARRVAFVEQHGMTEANMRVRDVVRLGRIPHHSPFSNWSAQDDEAITAALQRVAMLEKSEQGWLSLSGGERQRVHIARALAQSPSEILLDEPTNHLDIKACSWLEHFLMNYENTVIVVSHDRHFLNKVCTHIADVDYGKIKLFAGNYDFWYESSQLISRQLKDANSKKEEKIKELEDFIARFSANASKSRQATSRKKILDKITLDDLQPSTRKYPFIEFKPERESGRSILYIEDVEKQVEDCRLTNISFNMMKGDKVALIGNPLKTTLLLKLIAQELTPDAGSIQLGQTIKVSYIPDDNSAYFEGTQSICEWLSQYTDIDDMSFIRGFLGRMLFSGEEPLKPVNVLSGGEKARCMLSKTMLEAGNLLLMDDPINHLDLESIQTLNNALIKYPGELIFVSHDHQFIQTIANRIIEIRDDGIIDRRTTYDDYLEKEYGIEE